LSKTQPALLHIEKITAQLGIGFKHGSPGAVFRVRETFPDLFADVLQHGTPRGHRATRFNSAPRN
jgi:hypothetical protein